MMEAQDDGAASTMERAAAAGPAGGGGAVPKCGWLDKRGRWTGKWAARWLQLTTADAVLAYSETERGRLKGRLELASVRELAGAGEPQFEATTTGGQQWLFRAPSAADRDDWVEVIQEALNTREARSQAGIVWRRHEAGGEPPSERSDHACVLHRGVMFLFGGREPFGGLRGDLWALDLERREWRLVAREGTGVAPRCGHSAVLYTAPAPAAPADAGGGDGPPAGRAPRMFVFGGLDGQGQALDQTCAFDFGTYLWHIADVRGADRPSPRAFHGACLHGGDMYVFGGEAPANAGAAGAAGAAGGRELLFNDLFALSLDSLTWRQLRADRAPEPRRGLACFVRDRHLYVYGGHGAAGDRILASMYAWDLARGGWAPVEDRGTAPALAGHGACLEPGERYLLVYGGRKTGIVLGKERTKVLFESRTTWRFLFAPGDPLCGQWESLPCARSPPRLRRFAGVAYNGAWVIFGGIRGNSTKYNWLWSLPFHSVDVVPALA